jgi:hypothetical protein
MKGLLIGKIAGAGALGLVCLILACMALGCFYKRLREKREIRQAAEKQLREESLNRMILNDNSLGTDQKNAHNPYEVRYENRPGVQTQAEKARMLVSLEEKNELSVKKFVLDPANIIHIGSSLWGNEIVVQGEGIGEFHCEIFSDGGKVYVRSRQPGCTTVLLRKKERALVDGQGLRILTGDKILIGKVSYRIILTVA